MRKQTLRSWCFALLASMCVGGAAAAQDFAGKTVTASVGFEAGNRVDLFARMVGQTMMRYLPGQPTLVVLNRPGAGGVVALNDWNAKAEPNGLNITVGGQTQVDADALARMQARYQPAKFRYVGGLMAPSQGLIMNKAALPRLRDKSAAPVTMGIVGSTLRTGYYQVLWGAAFLDWNVRWVRGYKSTAEVRNALERGEVDMSAFGSTTDLDYLLHTGKFTVASQSGTIVDGKIVGRASFGDTPIISDLAKGKIKDPLAQKAFAYGEQVIQVGMFIALPAGTPDNIVAAYVQAFEKAVHDPEFTEAWAKIDPDSPVASKADLERLIADLGTTPPEALKFIRDELRRQGVDVSE
ncbi:MAG: Bug family tripartite tricarboxylate transporter substrate binding protein [Gemmatimonas sp.]